MKVGAEAAFGTPECGFSVAGVYDVPVEASTVRKELTGGRMDRGRMILLLRL